LNQDSYTLTENLTLRLLLLGCTILFVYENASRTALEAI